MKIQKIISLNDEVYALVNTQVDRLEEDEFCDKADYMVTESFHFFSGHERNIKYRHGLLAKINKELENENLRDYDIETIDKNEIDIISEKSIDIIDICSLSDFILISYLEEKSGKQKLGAYNPNEKSLKEIKLYDDYKIIKIATNALNKALVLIENDSEQNLLNIDFINSYELFNIQSLKKVDKNKEHIFDINFMADKEAYKIRQNYRTKIIGKIDQSKRKEKIFTSPNENYAVIYNDSFGEKVGAKKTDDRAKGNLHLHLRDFTDENYESFDFVKEVSDAVLKIERDFSNSFSKVDLDLKTNEIIKSMKEYFEEDEEFKTISISGIGYASTIALNLALKIKEKNLFGNLRLSALILENLCGDLLTYKYTSYEGRKIKAMDYKRYWSLSVLAKLKDLDIPCLIIADKEEDKFWYGSSLAFYGAGKFLDKDVRYLRIDDKRSEKASKKREEEIKRWIIEKN